MRTVCVQRVSKALFIGTLYWKHAVHSLQACDVLHDPDSIFFFKFFYVLTVSRLCVTGTNLGQRKHNEFRACALLVPNARLALVWRSSVWRLHSHVEKCSHFWACRKCAKRLTHTKNKWRSSGVIVKSSTDSDARPANHNALTKIIHFLCAGRAWLYVWLGLYSCTASCDILFQFLSQPYQSFH